MTTPEQPGPEGPAPGRAEGQAPERPRRASRKQARETVDTEGTVKAIVGAGRAKKVEIIQETEAETASRLRIDEENARAERDERRARMDHRRRLELIGLSIFAGVSLFVCLLSPCVIFSQGQRTLNCMKSGEFRTIGCEESSGDEANRSLPPWKSGGFNVRWPWIFSKAVDPQVKAGIWPIFTAILGGLGGFLGGRLLSQQAEK